MQIHFNLFHLDGSDGGDENRHFLLEAYVKDCYSISGNGPQVTTPF